MLRLFVGIALPPEMKLRLSLLCGRVPGANWVDPGNYHVTLRFIGEVGEGCAADIDEALQLLRARPFGLQLAGTGFFGGARPHSLWVGVERSPELVGLHDKIERALVGVGLPPEPRKFAPHVTLARLHNTPVAAVQGFLAASAPFRADELPVVGFNLIASYPTKSGGVYEDAAEYRLRA